MPKTVKKYYSIKAASDGAVDVLVYGEIVDPSYKWDSSEVSSIDFNIDLSAAIRNGANKVNIKINSPGGDCFQGAAIVNILKGCGIPYSTLVQGVAASMAGLLTVSSKDAAMPRNTLLMLHGPSSCMMGNAQDMRKEADLLDKVSQSFASDIAARTGLTNDEVVAKYFDGNDHWFTAQEALDAKLIDRIEEYDAVLPDGATARSYDRILAYFDDHDIDVTAEKRISPFSLRKIVASLFTKENKNSTMSLEKLRKAIADKKPLSLTAEEVSQLLTDVTAQDSALATAQGSVTSVGAELTAEKKKVTDLTAERDALQVKLDLKPAAATTTAAKPNDVIDDTNDPMAAIENLPHNKAIANDPRFNHPKTATK